jgi:PAS domain S-box-containing protein
MDESSRAGLHLLMEAAPVAVAAVDAGGRIFYANAKLEEMFGYAREELYGRPLEVLIPERFHRDHVAHRQDYREHPHVRPMGSGMDLMARRKDGTEFPIEVGLSYIPPSSAPPGSPFPAGEMVVMASIVDVTKRKQTEEMLEHRVEERTREIERRRRVSDSLRDTLALLNSNRPAQEILDHIAAQASRLLGAEATAIYQLQDHEPDDGEPLAILASFGLPGEYLTREHMARHGSTLAGAVFDGQPVAHVAADPGESTYYQAQLAVPLATQDDVYGGLMLYYREPRRFSAEEIELAVTFGEQAKLALENARLRAQAEQSAVVAERNRIARDLHDSVTQTLFSASLIAEVLPKLLARDPDETTRRLAELRQLTRGALAEMRTLLLELRPATLTEVDLNELLRQLAEAAVGRARIPVELTVEGVAPVPTDVKIALFHIAQEVLNNVIKHARAGSATVLLERHPGSVALTVRDDGRGFDTALVTPEHLGLAIMRERAEGIGATLRIVSHPGAGTTVSADWHSAGL